MAPATIFHVDVFATAPLTGNGLTVFLGTEGWSSAVMQRLTQEMKQFESIFLSEISLQGPRAWVFTVEEELPFAGHPVLGAAAVQGRRGHPCSATASPTPASLWTSRKAASRGDPASSRFAATPRTTFSSAGRCGRCRTAFSI
jgi:PhzF family phenazine biosynthesis protein